jgi:hypothetical protein
LRSFALESTMLSTIFERLKRGLALWPCAASIWPGIARSGPSREITDHQGPRFNLSIHAAATFTRSVNLVNESPQVAAGENPLETFGRQTLAKVASTLEWGVKRRRRHTPIVDTAIIWPAASFFPTGGRLESTPAMGSSCGATKSTLPPRIQTSSLNQTDPLPGPRHKSLTCG